MHRRSQACGQAQPFGRLGLSRAQICVKSSREKWRRSVPRGHFGVLPFVTRGVSFANLRNECKHPHCRHPRRMTRVCLATEERRLALARYFGHN